MSKLVTVVLLFWLTLNAHARPLYSSASDASPAISSLNKVIAKANALIPAKMASTVQQVEVIPTFFNQPALVGVEDICKAVSFQSGRATNKNKIYINQNYLNFLNTDPDFMIPCLGRTVYQQLIATLVHEYIHIYDSQDSGLYSRNNCSLESEMPSQKCQYLNQNKNILSGQKAFRNIFETIDAGQAVRSPNLYEFTDPKENLAVNFEYFILDEQYQCRRPVYYEFFKNNLEHNPFPSVSCDSFQYILQSEDKNLTHLKPEFIQSIRILNVSRGQKIDELFGHIMLQFNLCGQRKQKGLDFKCEERQLNSLIIDFGALTSATDKSAPIYARSLDQILINYLYRSNRSIESHELKLNPHQIKMISQFVLQQFWEYKGQYSSLKNNCAHVILRFLFSLFQPEDDIQYSTGIITPSYVKSLLIQRHLMDAQSRQVYSSENEIYFIEQMKLFMQQKNKLYPTDLNLESAEARRKFYLELSPADMNEQRNKYIYLEAILLRKAMHIVSEKLLHKDSSLAVNQTTVQTSYMTNSYGIPSLQELLQKNKNSDQQISVETKDAGGVNPSIEVQVVDAVRNNIFVIKSRN